MTKDLIKTIAVFFLLIFIISCDRPACKNTNRIFDQYTPETKEYKDELVKQLAKTDKSKLSYWMISYHEDDNSRHILVNIQGEGLCAKIILTIDRSYKGIEGIYKNKGNGYSGAELKDLKFDIKQDSVKTEFVFEEIGGISD